MKEHDKLIDALVWAAQNMVRRTIGEDSFYVSDEASIAAAKQALVAYIEQRTLTFEDALAIVCDDLLDVPSRSKRASALVDKCVGIIEEHDADVPFLSAPPEI